MKIHNIRLKANPFYLDDSQIEWLEKTFEEMTIEEKIGQLFCLVSYSGDEQQLIDFANKYKVGGVMGRPMPTEEVHQMISILQREAKIPMLIPANLEAGGDGLVAEGTNIGPNLQIGATNDADFAAKQGEVCAREGAAVGANWAFAPVVDIDYNFRNPITATRVFGSDKEFVKQCGVSYTKAVQKYGIAASVKHFPGDGVDERDQHLVTSVNSLSCKDWDSSYGDVYKACIEAGALTIMAGHIMLPAYSKKLRTDIRDEDILPATLASELLQDLLRRQLDFNGLIVSDATTMVGLNGVMHRSKIVPGVIAAGCDMFLFCKNIDEDFEYMKKGFEEGIITQDRLDEAVIRILALKAALHLPEKKENNTLVPSLEQAKKVIGCSEHRAIEKECSDRSVTLVKNKENILPLDSKKYRRVLVYPIVSGENALGYDGGQDISEDMRRALEKEGFEVSIYEPSQGTEGRLRRYDEQIEKYDLMIYVANMVTKSNQTVVRIEWAQPMGANCPIYINVIPTIFVSFANPYHLIDVPRIKTYINAYKFKQENIDAVMDKLMGRSEFKGIDPVDSFCGMWDTKL